MNPILTTGQTGLWEKAAVAMPSVAQFESDLLLYFTGSDGAANTLIGLATSADGFTWTKAEENPLLSAPTGNIGRFVPVIGITDSGLMVAYFDTRASPGQATGQSILRATAPAGP
jgi:hypothetical protein